MHLMMEQIMGGWAEHFMEVGFYGFNYDRRKMVCRYRRFYGQQQ